MDIPSITFRELHRIHRQLAELRSRLVRGPRQAAAAEANLARLEKERSAAKDLVTKSRVAVDHKELQLKEREGRIEDVRRKLNACKSNREYQALVEQIAADEQANSVLSDEILELYDRITAEQEAAKGAEATVEATQGELEKIRSRVTEERDVLEADLGRLTRELAEAENRLPGEIRADYLRMVKARGDRALAPLEGDCCGGCYQQTTPQMLNELRLSQFVLCKSCGCILYLPEDTSPAP
jgi:predicted  nucleic acid-binding Zn-ribbon protein